MYSNIISARARVCVCSLCRRRRRRYNILLLCVLASRALPCVCVIIIIIIYYSRILWRAYRTRSRVLCVRARAALSPYIVYAAGKKGTVADTLYTERSSAPGKSAAAVAGSTLCAHMLLSSSLIGGGQRVPILNIRSCSGAELTLRHTHTHPLRRNTITRRSFLL